MNATNKSNCIEETIHIGIAAAISAEEACINEEEELEIIE